nr:carbon-nitrogen hydrolase family protein [Tautonia plasticadhaerens]
MLTCWDLGFPSMAQELAMRHRVDAILVLAAWRGGTERSYGAVTRDRYWGYQWEVMNACRAMENQVWMLSCNATGTQGDAEFFGHSGAWAPSGVPLVVAEGPSLLVLRGLDLPGEVAREKANFNHTSEFFGVYRLIPEAGTFSRHPEGP